MESSRGYDRNIPNLSAAYINHGVTEQSPDNNHEAIALEPMGTYQSVHRDYDIPHPYESMKRAEKTPSRCSTKTVVFLVIVVIIVLAAVAFVGYYFINQSATSDDESNPPVVSNCPPDITLQLPANQTRIQVTWDEPTATDDVTPTSQLKQTKSHYTGQEFEIGTTDVIYTFTDGGGGTSVCNFNIIILSISTPDTSPPEISKCPDNFTISTNQNETSPLADWAEPTATDDSGIVNVESTHTPPSSLMLGPNIIEYTFMDPASNKASCVFVVTLLKPDITPPVISDCPLNLISVVALSGTNSATASWIEPTATDDSGLEPTRNRSHAPGSSFTVGTTVVTYRFTDGSGNNVACQFHVVVSAGGYDVIPPVIDGCPDDIREFLPSGNFMMITWNEPTATDDSGTTYLDFQSSTPGAFFQVNVPFEVIYVFADPSGNEATCRFTVSVMQTDITPPVISGCPLNVIHVRAPAGTNFATASWIEPTATDDSGLEPTRNRSHAPGSSFTVGAAEVTYRFTDGSGNSDACQFQLFVINGTNPCVPNPCTNPAEPRCFSFQTMYICRTPDAGRKRRGAEEFRYPCVNGGIKENHEWDTRCVCPSGFTGIFCEDVHKYNELEHLDRGEGVMTGTIIIALAVLLVVIVVLSLRLTTIR